MAEETKTEEEPSIEEILDSIRQIISEDDDGDDAPAADEEVVEETDSKKPEPEPEPEPAVEEESEPLDQSAIDDMDFDAPADEPVEEEPKEEVIELTDRIDDEESDVDVDWGEGEAEEEAVEESAPEPAPEPVVEEVAPEPEPVIDYPAPEPEIEKKPEEEGDNLLTEAAEEAAYSAISELTRKAAIDHSGVTLEDIVRSEIKPMLSIWLDKNLPVIIERLVQEELERVSKRVMEE